jgi:hypothetical protein
VPVPKHRDRWELGVNAADDVAHDVIDDIKEIGHDPLIAFGPEASAVIAVDELRRDAEPLATAPQRTGQDIASTELVGTVGGCAGRRRELLARLKRDDREIPQPRHLDDQVFGKAMAKDVLRCHERQHRYGDAPVRRMRGDLR